MHLAFKVAGRVGIAHNQHICTAKALCYAVPS
jgi:hypothetical protein